MDGTLAIIFLVAGLLEAEEDFCPVSCYARGEAPQRVTLQAGDLIYQNEVTGREVMLGYDFGTTFGPFQPTVGVSATEGGTTWAGIGAKWDSTRIWDSPLYIESALMVGAQTPGDGLDLGTPIQFRTSLGGGYMWENGSSVAIVYDHRSNGDIAEPNPGIETLTLRFAYGF